jgi:Flp pilus assembly protein TadG
MTFNHIPRSRTDRVPRWALLRALVERVPSLHSHRLRGLRTEAGAAMVEFALVLPVFLLLVFVVFDFGRAINYWIDETHLASEGARLAAVNASAGGDIRSYIRDRADTTELREGGTSSISAPLKVCIDFPPDPDDSSTGEVGDPVQVTVSTTYRWMPFIGADVATTEIKGSATHRLERVPSYSEGCLS